MESLEGLWKKFSLLDEEETGVACPKKDAPENFILAAKFTTKRVVNVESVARTFRPLWRLERDVQIKDMGDNILSFNFEDECDLNRVIEHELWTYDKHLVVFEKVVENVPISALSFQYTSFWIQIHDLPIHCLNSETREAIGSSLGTPLLMTDLEGEGGKGNYLRVRVKIDITKPLNRVRKVWSEGVVIGCAILKYERLPNFCYWCGLVSHDDRDCEHWLWSKGSLKKTDQHYRDWMRAKVDLNSRKTSITILGSKPRYPKSKTTPKPQPRSTTQPPESETSDVQDTTTPSGNLHLAPAENPKPSPPDTLNGTINAHNSEARSEENQNLNAANGYANIPDLVHVTKLSIKSNNDSANMENCPAITQPINTQTAKPKMPAQYHPTLDEQPITEKPSKHTKSPPKTLPTKPTWVRIPRDHQKTPSDVHMIETENTRPQIPEEDCRPIKRQTVSQYDALEPCQTVVAAWQPRRAP